MKAEPRHLKLVAVGLATLLAVTGWCASGQATADNAIAVTAALTPDNALAFAWTNHPGMKAAQAMVEAAYGSRVQASLWPKPELGLSHMSKVEVKSEDGVSFSQKFELGGKRNARISMADAETFARQSELLDQWLEVRADIKEAFSRLAYARETLSLAEQRARAGIENEELTRNLEKAGKVSALELIDSQQEAGMAKASAASAAVRAGNAEREVFFSLGMQPPDGARTVVCPTNKDIVLPDTGTLLNLAMTNSPAVRTSRALRLVAEARERIAATSKWPDLTLGAQYSRMTMNDGGSGNGSTIMASIDLPLFNRGQGDRLEARQERIAAEAGQDESAFDTVTRASELVSDCNQRLADHTYLSQTAVPLAQKKHALNEDAFRKGRLSRRARLQSLRELLEVQGKCAEARLMLDTAATEIERLTLIVNEPPQR